jgi:hypothetical protein
MIDVFQQIKQGFGKKANQITRRANPPHIAGTEAKEAKEAATKRSEKKQLEDWDFFVLDVSRARGSN